MRFIYCLPEISHPGGIGRITSIKANYLASIGHEVTIITTDQNKLPSYFNLHRNVKLIDFNINFNSNEGNLIKKLLHKIIKLHKYKNQLSNFIYQNKPDYIISTFTNEASFLYKIKDGSKKILECHFNHDLYKCMGCAFQLPNYMKLYYEFKTKRNEYIIKKYDAFVTLTNEDAILWGHQPNLHVIPNILSFNINEQATLINKRIIAVGRLDAQKKFDRLLNIWSKVTNQVSNWELYIFGQGPDKEILKNLISALNLQNNTFIKSPTPNIITEYMKSSILVMTSTYEGFGMVLTEAMACGLPVIAYGCKCGPKDIIVNGENGFCINNNDETDFINKLLYIMQNYQERIRMGNNAKLYSKKYTQDTIMKIWMNLFYELKNKSPH